MLIHSFIRDLDKSLWWFWSLSVPPSAVLPIQIGCALSYHCLPFFLSEFHHLPGCRVFDFGISGWRRQFSTSYGTYGPFSVTSCSLIIQHQMHEKCCINYSYSKISLYSLLFVVVWAPSLVPWLLCLFGGFFFIFHSAYFLGKSLPCLSCFSLN